MKRTYTLAQLMALSYAPPQMVQLAADTGCAATGARLLPVAPGGVHYPLMDDAPMLRETLARMAATGVKILDLEIICLDERFDPRAYLRFFDVGQQLGARHITVLGNDPDESRLTASFAALCEAAKPFGLSADLEFMRWTQVPDLQAAVRIVSAAGGDNAGILVDALHLARSGNTPQEVAALPRQWLHYAQICDGPVPGPDTLEGLIHAARCERLLPGEGQLDLQGLFAQVPPEVPVSVEVPSDTRAPAMGYTQWTRRAVEAARGLLETAP